MKLANLLKAYALPAAIAELEIAGLSLDSRKVEAAWVFVALQGASLDGRKYIGSAIANGATAIFQQAEKFDVDVVEDTPLISIPELTSKLSEIAGCFYGDPSHQLEVIGITGTNGKSTCVSLLAQASELLGKPAWQIGTVGYGKPKNTFIETGLTTPDAISCQKILSEAQAEATLVAMEISSHAIVQERVAGIDFVGGVFTNITRDHLDYHETFEDYCEAKLSFLRDYNLDFVVLNYDDSFSQKILREDLLKNIRIYTFSTSNSNADVWAKLEKHSVDGLSAYIYSPWGEGKLVSSLAGEFNLSNLLAVISVLAARGHAMDQILKAVQALRGVEGRLQKVDIDELSAPAVFIDYAHTPDALLNTLIALKNIATGELWVIFGCGGDRDRGKRAQMAEIAENNAQHVIVTSDNPRTEDPQNIVNDILTGFSDKYPAQVFVDRREAIEYAVAKIPVNACLLIAGKGHEKYQIVGEQRLPFDDYLIAKNALNTRFYQQERAQ